MSKKIFKKIALTLSLFLSILTLNSFQVKAATQSTNTVNNELSVNDINFLSTKSNIENALSKLNNVALTQKDFNTKVRSIKLTDNLILEEELTSIEIPNNTLTRATKVSRQVTSKVNIKNNIGLTVTTLTAIGYFNHNGSTSAAYDADYAVSSSAFYSSSGYVSYIGTSPVQGYARISCRYYVKGSLGFEWGNVTISELNILANVFCNQNGDYYSQWN